MARREAASDWSNMPGAPPLGTASRDYTGETPINDSAASIDPRIWSRSMHLNESRANAFDRAGAGTISNPVFVSFLNTTPIVALNVGEAKEKFYVHKQLLLWLCGFFRAAFTGRFLETFAEQMDMPEDQPDAVGLMIHWCYHGTLPRVVESRVPSLEALTQGGWDPNGDAMALDQEQASQPPPVAHQFQQIRRDQALDLNEGMQREQVRPDDVLSGTVVPSPSIFYPKPLQKMSQRRPLETRRYRHVHLRPPPFVAAPEGTLPSVNKGSRYIMDVINLDVNTSFEEQRLSFIYSQQYLSRQPARGADGDEFGRRERSIKTYLEEVEGISTFAASKNRLEGELLQLRLVQLIIMADKYDIKPLVKDGISAYLDGERVFRRTRPPLRHIDLAYGSCLPSSPFTSVMADYAFEETMRRRNQIELSGLLSKYPDFIEHFLKRLRGCIYTQEVYGSQRWL